MCKAIKDLRKEEYQDGHKTGREEGSKKAILTSLKALMKNMGLSAEQAMNVPEIPEAERPTYLDKL